MLSIQQTTLNGCFLATPALHEDERGSFAETFQQNELKQAAGRELNFIQDNESFSRQGVVRGLHFQRHPHAQAKLVRCVSGLIFDVAVDLREQSPTFMKWFGCELGAANKSMLFIPEGFAHGFMALQDSIVLYKVNAPRHIESEESIHWLNPFIHIDWPKSSHPVLSQKDSMATQQFPSFQGHEET